MNNKLIPSKVKNNKSLEYLEELKSICIKDGKINLNSLVQIWEQVPNKVKVDILPTLMQEFSIDKDEIDGTYIENVNFVGNLWKYTPRKIQEATIEKAISALITNTENNEKIIELENLSTLLYATTDKKIISKNIGKIIKELSKSNIINIEDAYKEIYKELPIATNYNIFDIARINRRKNPIKLNKRTIMLLENKLKNNVPIILEVENVAELNNTEIQNFVDKGLNIQYIQLKGDKSDSEMDHVERLPYNIETYMKCREKIDKIIKNVGYTVNQKELFIKVVKEISKIHYLHKCEEISENGNNKLNDCMQMYGFRNMYVPCSNLEGLITGQTICGGYAEIINNIMSCYGTESVAVEGDHEFGIKHIWNQVKLDGIWYNADVTYDSENIRDKKKAYWLLRSDKDFLIDIDGKSFYTRHIPSKSGIRHICSQSVPYEEVNKYLNNTFVSGSDNNSNNIPNKRMNELEQGECEIEDR